MRYIIVMKKFRTIVTALCSLVFAVSASAQVYPWEFDLSFMGSATDGNNSVFVGGLFMDYRHNIKESPFDVGAEMSILVAPWRQHDNVEKGQIEQHAYGLLSCVGDFNIRSGVDVDFFVGLGAGAGVGYRLIFEDSENWINQYHFVMALTPRIGLEISHRFRLSGQFRLSTDGSILKTIRLDIVLHSPKKK